MSRSAWKLGLLGACLLAATVSLFGCGAGEQTESEEGTTSSKVGKPAKAPPPADVFKDLPPPECPSHAEPFSVTLDAEVAAENVGVMVAAERGFFTDAGLEVSVGGPKTPRRAVRYVATGIDDIGLAQQPQVVMARAEGVPIVAFGSVLPQPTATMLWLPDSGIGDIADLDGRTIAVPGVPFQEELLGTVLARAGLSLDDVEIEDVNYKPVIALQEGRADALFGGTWNIEGAALEAEGVQPVIERVQGLGVPDYEEVVAIARSECVSEHPEVFRDFMAAVARGTEAARKHRKQAEHVIAINRGFDPEFSREKLRAQLDATLPLLTTNRQMDLRQAADLSAWMREEGIVEQEPPVADTFTNDFLATP